MKILEHINRDSFLNLAIQDYDACLSLYMPVIQAGSATRQNLIRFKDLCAIAEDKLLRYGVSRTLNERLLDPLNALSYDWTFWEKRSPGLAVFVTPEDFFIYRAPLAFEEDAIVDKRIFIRPLLPLLDREDMLQVMLVNPEGTRFLKCHSYICAETRPPAELESFKIFIGHFEFEKSLQHGAARTGQYYHGYGSSGDKAEHNRYLEDYYKHVKNWLSEKLKKNETLYLVGDSRNTGLFSSVAEDLPCDIKVLLKKNIKSIDDEELLASVREEIEKNERKRVQAQIDNFAQVQGEQPEKTLQDTAPILSAAHDKRIRTLFLPPLQDKVWGVYDADSHKTDFEETPEEAVGEELYNLAAIRTLQNGGAVVVDRNPASLGGAAICHW